MSQQKSSTLNGPAVFVARQPILDKSGRLRGYELLYRQSSVAENRAGASDDVATASVIEAMFGMGFDTLTGGKRAFVNVSRALLVEGVPEVLPKDRVVIELGPDVAADDQVLAACRELKKIGYALALDHFTLSDRTEGLLPFADFIKVDFQEATRTSVRLPAFGAGEGPALVANRVETAERFQEAVVGGYDLFQGFFLGKPTLKETRTVPAQHMAGVRLLHALNDPDITIRALEELVRHDPALCFLILRTVNSAAYALRTTVHSIHDALVLLGRDTIRRWASLWALSGLSQHAHAELVTMATIRARCCELLGASTPSETAASEGFLVGMCSLLDAILEQPMPALLASLPVSPTVRDALLGGDNGPRRMLDCAVAYEEGNWDECFTIAKSAGVNPAVLPAAYSEALRWADQLKTDGKR
jgi:EAL and modified HD-GYP domain-containing signal transduction protein